MDVQVSRYRPSGERPAFTRCSNQVSRFADLRRNGHCCSTARRWLWPRPTQRVRNLGARSLAPSHGAKLPIGHVQHPGLLGLMQLLVATPALPTPEIPPTRVSTLDDRLPVWVPGSAEVSAVAMRRPASRAAFDAIFAKKFAASAKPAPIASFWRGLAPRAAKTAS